MGTPIHRPPSSCTKVTPGPGGPHPPNLQLHKRVSVCAVAPGRPTQCRGPKRKKQLERLNRGSGRRHPRELVAALRGWSKGGQRREGWAPGGPCTLSRGQRCFSVCEEQARSCLWKCSASRRKGLHKDTIISKSPSNILCSSAPLMATDL